MTPPRDFTEVAVLRASSPRDFTEVAVSRACVTAHIGSVTGLVCLAVAGAGHGFSDIAVHAVNKGATGSRRSRRERSVMGLDDKIDNKTKEMTGRAKENLGKATGDRSMQAEGRKDRTVGDVKQAGEKVKDAFKR
jgi:uncharacterized protein YjbJ (UPF0337 family)